MIGFLSVMFIFSLLIGITVSLILYFIKKYLLKKKSDFKKNIWIGVITTITWFVLITLFINGMDHI